MRTRFFAAFGLAALCACDVTINPADTDEPEVSVTLLTPGLPLVYHTNSAQALDVSACAPGTSKKAEFGFIPDNRIYVTDGENAVEILVSFQDPSGIAEATIKFPVGPIETPENTTLSTIQHGSQSTGLQVRKYSFAGDPNDPKSPHLVTIKHTPTGSNRTYNFTAKDFNNNSLINSFVVIGNQASICQ